MKGTYLDGAYRTTLQPGQYVTVHGGGLAGAAIRAFTHAPVAHAYVYVGRQPSGHDMVEAQPGGVRLGDIRSYDWATSFQSETRFTPLQSAAITRTALACVGKPYGWLADMFIGMRQIRVPWVGGWMFKLHSVTSRMECAQLADYCALANGVHYFNDGRQPGSVSPADLYHRDYK